MRHLFARARLICNPGLLPHFRQASHEVSDHRRHRSPGTSHTLGDSSMRSDLIFGALTHVNNRYKLCQLASKATRKLHKPNTRLQDTTNEVLDRFKDTVPMNVTTEVATMVPERRAA